MECWRMYSPLQAGEFGLQSVLFFLPLWGKNYVRRVNVEASERADVVSAAVLCLRYALRKSWIEWICTEDMESRKEAETDRNTIVNANVAWPWQFVGYTNQ